MGLDNSKTAIWWIRRDLRLDDNQALTAATESHAHVIPLFVLDETLLKNSNSARNAFLFANLFHLDQALRQRGSRLILRRGDPIKCLVDMYHECSADAVFAERDHTPYAIKRDQRAAQALPLQLLPGVSIAPPESILKSDQTPYTVFTPYSRRWKDAVVPIPPLPAPEHLPLSIDLHSEPIPAHTPHALFPTGEHTARERVEAFFARPIHEYGEKRDLMGIPGTSMLSPYLHLGILSIRYVYTQALNIIYKNILDEEKKGVQTWINELIWRDFYMMILHHFPHVLRGAFREKYDRIIWRDDKADLQAWQDGLTGYPIVDAAMRQLKQTGWMHNRARMIVASFLCKDLLINWQLGEEWFMQNLVDGDTAANNGGWQWSAGTGTDAAPYFRIFNPITQSKKYDPEGIYIRKWLPELSDLPNQYIHTPFKLSPSQQKEYGCQLGKHYPQPIVDHAAARTLALAVYKAAIKGPS